MKGLYTRSKGKVRLVGASMSPDEFRQLSQALPTVIPLTHAEAIREGFTLDGSEADETADGRRGNGLAEFVHPDGRAILIPFTVVRQFGKPRSTRIREAKR